MAASPNGNIHKRRIVEAGVTRREDHRPRSGNTVVMKPACAIEDFEEHPQENAKERDGKASFSLASGDVALTRFRTCCFAYNHQDTKTRNETYFSAATSASSTETIARGRDRIVRQRRTASMAITHVKTSMIEPRMHMSLN